jgi:hypothetical protein
VSRFETRCENEDGKPVISCALIPQYPKTEENKKQMKALDERLVRRELWFMEQEEERKEARARARKKRTTTAATRKKRATKE